MNLFEKIKGYSGLISSGFGYMPILALALALLMARLFAAAKLLSITEFANYNIGLLVSSSFCMLGCLGLQTMLQREWPGLVVTLRSRRGMVLCIQAILIAILCAVIIASGLLLWSSYNSDHGSTLRPSILAVGILNGLAQQIFVLVTVESRSRGMTILFAGQYLLRAIIILGIGVAVMTMRDSGLLVLFSEALITAIVSCLILLSIARRAHMGIANATKIAAQTTHKLRWWTAFGLLSATILSWSSQNIDRWLGQSMLDVHEFAMYAFAANLLTIAGSAQMILNSSVFPQLARTLAVSGRRTTFLLCSKYCCALGGIGIISAPLVWLGWVIAVRHWYPAYESSNTLAIIFIISGILRCSDFWGSYLIIVGSELKLKFATIIALSISFTVWYVLFIKTQEHLPTMTSIAWLACIIAVCTYIANTAFALREVRR